MDVDIGDAWLLTGRFSVHWEAADGSDFVEGPSDVEIGEALRWARDRAAVVLVRVDDRFYSAGEESDPSLPAWPPSGFTPAPRPVGAPPGVRPGEAVQWILRSVVSCDAGGGAAQRETESLKENLEVDKISDVSIMGSSCVAEYVVRAKGSMDGMLKGERAVEDALEVYRQRVGSDDGAHLQRTTVLGPAYTS